MENVITMDHANHQTANPQSRRLLRAEELAAILDLHPVTVRNWQLAGKIPHLRLGTAVRFDLYEVLEAMRQNATGVRDAQ